MSDNSRESLLPADPTDSAVDEEEFANCDDRRAPAQELAPGPIPEEPGSGPDGGDPCESRQQWPAAGQSSESSTADVAEEANADASREQGHQGRDRQGHGQGESGPDEAPSVEKE